MTESKSQEYILGTERAELLRLGLQHQVWAQEARNGWKTAGFRPGQTLLDLGCGPGFCTQDMAYIVGERGSIVAVDQSPAFIQFALAVNQTHALNIDYREASFDDMTLEDESLDGAFCRWALAWVPNPEEVVAKVASALRPNASFVVHEYYDWSTFQTEPHFPELNQAIASALRSFRDSEGDIVIGRRLPEIFTAQGLEVTTVRSMARLVRPDTLGWHWPTSFLEIYLPKLVANGLLEESVCSIALQQWEKLSTFPVSSCLCPQMVEVIARKPPSA
ncbi:MAG: ubiquinone/menaquinone biosynthesis C-methylase UbiE [Lysobacterales bacterium]|jgi:ubiquinone/menaquinone biosynthesis C-methylase UbiE